MKKYFKFEDIFSIQEIQKLQSAFFVAYNLTSVITLPDGTPLTEMVGYPDICSKIIRPNPKGVALCTKYASCIAGENDHELAVKPCLSCGLLNASLPILVKGQHLANWIIGPVRIASKPKAEILQSAKAIGEDEDRFLEAYNKVSTMEVDELSAVAKSWQVVVHMFVEKAITQYMQKETIDVLQLTQTALSESEERFQSLFQQAPLGYQSLDIDGNLIEVNQKWLDTLGYTYPEVIGKWFGDFLTPNFKDGFRKRFPIFKALGVIHSEFEMVHKNGEIRFIAFDGRIGKTDSGDFKQTHCILQDITETHQAQNALKASEEKFRNLFDQSPIGKAIVDLDKHFVLCNNAFCNFLGYTADELIGKTIADITHPDDLNVGLSEMVNISNNQLERVSLEKRYLRKDGVIVWGEVTICAIHDQHGEPIFFLPIIQDITARKEAEQELNVRVDELIRFQKVTVNRELTMIALKDEVNQLLTEAGRTPKYTIVA